MPNKKLWSPTATNSLLKKFQNSISKDFNLESYNDLHKWSIENKNNFWDKIWNFTNICGLKKGQIYETSNEFINEKFFNDSYLNYTENCLLKNDDADAIIFYNEKIVLEKIKGECI